MRAASGFFFAPAARTPMAQACWPYEVKLDGYGALTTCCGITSIGNRLAPPRRPRPIEAKGALNLCRVLEHFLAHHLPRRQRTQQSLINQGMEVTRDTHREGTVAHEQADLDVAIERSLSDVPRLLHETAERACVGHWLKVKTRGTAPFRHHRPTPVANSKITPCSRCGPWHDMMVLP